MIFSINDDVQEIQFVEASSGYGKGRDYLVHAPESKQSQSNNAGHYVSRDDFNSLRKLARDEREKRQYAQQEEARWRDKFYEVNKVVQSLKNQLAEVATAKDRASERCAAKDADTREGKAIARQWEKMYNVLYKERCDYRNLLQDAVSDKKKAEEKLRNMQVRRITDAQCSGAGYIRASELAKLMEAKEQVERLKRYISTVQLLADRGRIKLSNVIADLVDIAKDDDE
jgi:uncharacterized coiled-coil DUF342 family protein